ncbi:hypothetical protein F8M41_001568 [Gigaspora margarita]|uniref:Uncharacterized protein n=1 Tax=Gigaspora margarita TaxID=4874 RepID=A0A8H3XG77_GIGMA|nr:hypothetical protein F8M41_001568 [Gigaspora margarita]
MDEVLDTCTLLILDKGFDRFSSPCTVSSSSSLVDTTNTSLSSVGCVSSPVLVFLYHNSSLLLGIPGPVVSSFRYSLPSVLVQFASSPFFQSEPSASIKKSNTISCFFNSSSYSSMQNFFL